MGRTKLSSKLERRVRYVSKKRYRNHQDHKVLIQGRKGALDWDLLEY